MQQDESAREQALPANLVRLIVDDGGHHPGLWEAVDRLGFRRGAAFRCIVLPRQGRGSPFGQRSRRSLDLPLQGAVQWAERPNMTVGLLEDEAVDVLDVQRSLTEAGATGGVGPAMRGWPSAPRAMRYAAAAGNGAARGTIVVFERSPLESVAGGSPDIAARASQEVLGPLLELSVEQRRLLLETVNAWFEEAGSIAAVAARLFVHANTVRNRLGQFEEVVGLSLRRPMDVAAVAVALVTVRTAALDQIGDR